MFYMLGEEGGRVLVTLIVYTIFIYFVSQLLNSHTNSLCFCFLIILMTYLDHMNIDALEILYCTQCGF